MNSRNRRFYLLVLAMLPLCASGAFAAAPTISVFAPTSGALNTSVTLTGTNFVTPMTVSFNGVNSSSVTVVNSTTAKATVPSTASTGAITVATSGGSATSTGPFTVLPGVVTSTAVGPPTAAVTFYYSGFGAYEPVDLYFDTADVALSSASANGAGNFALTIPASARPGAHWITAIGRRSVNSVQALFTVRSSWPQFGFAPNHKGKDRYENVLSSATVSDLDVAWQTPVIGTVYCTPAIVNGIVYSSFGDGTIRAFDEITGAQKWSYATGGENMFSSPAVSNGIVYAGSDDQYLYALDAVTGLLKWRFVTAGAIYSSPNVVNGIVYFGSYDNNVYALNATTGALVWNVATGGTIYSSPMIANGVVYVGSFDFGVYALNALTGAKIWRFATMGAVGSSPVLVGGLVCVGSVDSYMYALDAATGVLDWEYTAGADINSSAAVAEGALFFGASNGNVYSLTAGGALRWSTALPNFTGDIYSPVSVANGVVYIRDSYYTFALDQNTGALLTTLRVGGIYGGAAAVNGAVFGGDQADGVLTRYTPNALQSNYIAPRPDPMQLRPHLLR